jgi:hypothetical protein
MIKTFTFTLFLLLTINQAYAQSKRDSVVEAALNATGSLNKTNTASAYLLNNALNLRVKADSLSFNANAAWLYGKQNGTLTNNDFSAVVYADLHTHIRHFYYWALYNYNTSYSLKINSQALAGAGIAYGIIDHKKAWLNVSDGLVYDQSDLLTADVYHTWRNSFRLMFHFETRFFTLNGADFFQNSLSNGGDYIIRTTTTAGLKLQSWLSFTTSLTYNKMNITHSYNTIYTYGITIDQYF